MRQHRECHADRTDGAAVYVRHASAHCQIVGQVAGLEIVEAIDHQVHAVRVAGDVGVVDIVDDRRNTNVRIDLANTPFRRFRLWHSLGDIALVE